MLHADSKQPLGFPFMGVAFDILITHRRLPITFDTGPIAGNRKATLFFKRFPFAGDNFRVNSNNQIIRFVLGRAIKNNEALQFANLSAARPTPGASYMVSTMSAASCFSSSSNSVTGSDFSFSRGSGIMQNTS
jgi:hypothetical protein